MGLYNLCKVRSVFALWCSSFVLGSVSPSGAGAVGDNANVIPEVETNAPTRIVFQHCVCMWEYSAAHVFAAAPGCYGVS